jgi:hypothetical protein
MRESRHVLALTVRVGAHAILPEKREALPYGVPHAIQHRRAHPRPVPWRTSFHLNQEQLEKNSAGRGCASGSIQKPGAEAGRWPPPLPMLFL